MSLRYVIRVACRQLSLCDYVALATMIWDYFKGIWCQKH